MGHIWGKRKSVRALHCRIGKGPGCGNCLHVLVPWNECEWESLFIYVFGSIKKMHGAKILLLNCSAFEQCSNKALMKSKVLWNLNSAWSYFLRNSDVHCFSLGLWQLLNYGYVQLNAAYDALTSKRPCGPNKRAIQGATYDLAKNDPWKEPFENLPEYAFEDMTDWERKLIRDRVITLRGTWTL